MQHHWPPPLMEISCRLHSYTLNWATYKASNTLCFFNVRDSVSSMSFTALYREIGSFIGHQILDMPSNYLPTPSPTRSTHESKIIFTISYLRTVTNAQWNHLQAHVITVDSFKNALQQYFDLPWFAHEPANFKN